MSNQEDVNINKRIAKNAAALYLRMIISMLVGLYTSRVILQALGIEDYGIYNVVGGFVSMFSLISNSLQASVQRFLTFELGKGYSQQLQVVFSTSFFVLLGLSILVIFVTEIIGLWYLQTKLVLPASRLFAAQCCFHLSLLSFALSLLCTPYVSSIISHEDMNVYAYMSILDVVFKLLICYVVMESSIDRLICYAVLLFTVGLISQLIYWIYCRRKYPECKVSCIFDRTLFLQMFAFSGWNFIGSSAAILRSQGASLLLNAFGGPLVNAANGIANTISSVVSSFVGNFTQAFNPQITKQYAAGQYDSLMKLVVYSSKYSYFLMLILSMPVMFNTEYILKTWLGIVPSYTVTFTRWILVMLLLDTVTRPIITLKLANSNIRNYQIVVGGVILLVIPLSYIGLSMGLPVTFVAVVNAFVSFLAMFVRIYMMRGDFAVWSSMLFIRKVLIVVFYVSLASSVLPFISYYFMPYGFYNVLVTTTLSVISTVVMTLFLGCTSNERIVLLDQMRKISSSIRSVVSR
ncbi:MAG: lipopolysaccharide biosynthesis protein [Prevotellamassilia sp.]|nr:lipopolysaccharide biosynthesis protein [Prevotellamassilia sp.]